jgi:uncharacterized protein
MAFTWHIFGTFAYLRWIDKLSFQDSLSYLGLNRWDWKGLYTVLPLAIIVVTLFSTPYEIFIRPSIFEFLNNLPFFHIYDWHIQKTGYFTFPLVLIILSFIGAHIGEEIYFRGFLLQKLGDVRYIWLFNQMLFLAYHFWQAPTTWPGFFMSPFGSIALLVVLRKNLWIAVCFHIFYNFLFGDAMNLMAPLYGFAMVP